MVDSLLQFSGGIVAFMQSEFVAPHLTFCVEVFGSRLLEQVPGTLVHEQRFTNSDGSERENLQRLLPSLDLFKPYSSSSEL